MFLIVLVQSWFYGLIFLAIHWFGHVWPVAAKLQEIKDIFSGPLIIVYYALNILAFPLDQLLGWTWSTLGDFNLWGPIFCGYLLTAYKMRKKAKGGAQHVNR